MAYISNTSDTSTWGNGNQYIWIHPSNNSYYYRLVESKKEKEDFISEKEFKV
jgi:hypothetical protein